MYTLEPYTGLKSRYTCPACMKKGVFTRYVHIETGEHLSEIVGRCNREVKCGYHHKPVEYLESKGLLKKNLFSFEKVKPKPKNHLSVIPFSIVEKSLHSDYLETNNLVKYLKKIVGNKWIECVTKFKIGSASHWPGSTVFWQIDHVGNVRTGKIILYNSITGKRIKEPYSHITWVHTLLTKKGLLNDFNLAQCLFGEHQLMFCPEKPVGIVESEKTALIASIYLPELTWMATGSLTNISIERFKPLSKSRIILYPDINGFEKWAAKSKELGKNGFKITVSDLLEKAPFVNETDREQGLDLGDYLPRNNLPKTDLEVLIDKNPLIADLVKRFELTVQ